MLALFAVSRCFIAVIAAVSRCYFRDLNHKTLGFLRRRPISSAVFSGKNSGKQQRGSQEADSAARVNSD